MRARQLKLFGIVLVTMLGGGCDLQWPHQTPPRAGDGLLLDSGAPSTETVIGAIHGSTTIAPGPSANMISPGPASAVRTTGLPAYARMRTVKANGFVHLGSLSVPGYYTVILFSGSWCAPCEVMWKETPLWLDRYPNVLAIDVDIGGAANDGTGPEAAIFRDLELSELPGAVVVGPFGQTTKRASGLDQVRALFAWLEKRKHQAVLPFPEAPILEARPPQFATPESFAGSAPPVIDLQPNVSPPYGIPSEDAGFPDAPP